MKNVDINGDISCTWKDNSWNIGTPAEESPANYELKQHKIQFEEECSELLDQRKRGKFQRLRNTR